MEGRLVSKRRAYKGCVVKNILLKKVLAGALDGPVTVGLDIGKSEVFAVLRWKDGTFERPWKMRNPTEIMVLTRLLQELAQQRPMMVTMESTGTYGDPLRQALTDAGLDVRRVSGKAVSDYAEIFDGVSSKHDGKDAAIVAELTAFGKSWAWPYVQKNEHDAKMAYYVDWLDAQQDVQMLWTGRLESQSARHWPELTKLLSLTSVTLLKILIHYGGPTLLCPRSGSGETTCGMGAARRASQKKQTTLDVA